MRFRSCVLLSCMLVVPLLAMFSHRIPAEAREAVRTHVWQPAVATVSGLVGKMVDTAPQHSTAAGAAEETPTIPAETVAGQPRPVASIGEPANLAGSSAAVPPPRAAVPDHPLATAPQPGTMPAAESAPTVAATPPATEAAAGRRRLIEASLTNLGAVAIRCEPLAGHAGMHVGSCHVAIDAGGQLQRVFQAAGADPDTALEHLLDEVLAWRGRAAIRQAGDAPATRNGGAIRL